MSLALDPDYKGPCPVCGTGACACRSRNAPFVGRPIDGAAMFEKDGIMTVLRAPERVYVDVAGVPGLRRLLYKKGDPVSQKDAVALGLLDDRTGKPPRAKSQPKPSASPGSVPRDKALRGPREPKKEE